jgi:hypothetical protein
MLVPSAVCHPRRACLYHALRGFFRALAEAGIDGRVRAMAFAWIKIEDTTPDKPEVWAMAERLGIDADAVVGKLVRIWIWADQQTVNGNARSVTKALLDRCAGVTGFADAMMEAGWLVAADGGVSFVNFDRHNGETAKKRAQTARRVQRHRAQGDTPAGDTAERNAASVTSGVTKSLPEKRREDSLYISGAKLANTEPLNIAEQKASNEHLTTLLESGRTTGAEIEQREDVQKYAAEWIRHLEEKAVDKVPYVGTAHHGEFWALLHEIGPDRFVAAIRYTIRNGWLNIREEVKERKARGSKSAQPDTDPDFLRAVQVCKEFPSGSDYDREKREAALGPLIRIVRKMTSARLAECDKFTQKQLAAEWGIVREGMK